MSQNPALNKPLSSKLLYTYKSLRELRQESDLNRLLYTAYFEDKGINKYDINSEERCAHESILENCINEAYRICAQFFADHDPLEDVEYHYYYENMGLFTDIKDYQITISFVIILLIGYNEYSEKKYEGEHDPQKINIFVNELRGILLNSDIDYKYIYRNLDDNIFLKQPDLFENLDLKPQPTPIGELILVFDKESIFKATNEFDQDTIINIVERYKSKKEKLALLEIIHNVFLDNAPLCFTFPLENKNI